MKKPGTIRLDEITISYFKKYANEIDVPYHECPVKTPGNLRCPLKTYDFGEKYQFRLKQYKTTVKQPKYLTNENWLLY
jgi:hypothetical protein